MALSDLPWAYFLMILDHWQNRSPVHHDPWPNATADLSSPYACYSIMKASSPFAWWEIWNERRLGPLQFKVKVRTCHLEDSCQLFIVIHIEPWCGTLGCSQPGHSTKPKRKTFGTYQSRTVLQACRDIGRQKLKLECGKTYVNCQDRTASNCVRRENCLSFIVTDTCNVPRFSFIAGPFDLGRKHVRNCRRKPRILNSWQYMETS